MEEKNYDNLMSKYPILFQQKNKSQMETCMCWGIECGIGWYEPLDRLCNDLEQLNNDYERYRIQIQAQQVKEKYGGLRFYFNVYFKKSLFEKIFLLPFNIANKLLNRFDYNIDYSNGELVAKKHRFLFKIKLFLTSVTHINFFKNSQKRIDKANLLHSIADNLIQNCEKDCWNTCEICGKKNDYSETKIITTSGWISRICTTCSKKQFAKSTEEYDKKHPEEKYNGIDRITLFREGYYFLNFYESKSSFKYNQKYYSSIPHVYFSIKDKENSFLYDEVKNPSLIEKIAKKFNVFYDENDYELIKDIIRAKFTDDYHKEFKEQLIATGDKMIIYLNGYCDNVLGECFCEECQKEKGKNLYGKALMEIREELKNQ